MQRLRTFAGFCAVVAVGFRHPLTSEKFDNLAARALKSIQLSGIAVAIKNVKGIHTNGSRFQSLYVMQPVYMDTIGLLLKTAKR